MTGIPAKTSFTGGSVTQGQFKTTLDQLIDALDERLVNGATPIQADTINEASVGAGVTLDGLLVKDGEVHLDLGGAKTVKLLNLSAEDYGKLLQVAPDGAALEAIGPSYGFKNKLINGDFRIWQRGVSGFGHSECNADRWREDTTTNDTISISRQTFTPGQTDVPGESEFYLRASLTAGSTGSVNDFRQRIEGVRTFAGKVVTLSYYARASTSFTQVNRRVGQYFGTGGSPSSSVTINLANIAVTTSWQKFTTTFTAPSLSGKTIGANGNDYLDLVLGLPINMTVDVDIAQVQLETGPTATPFEERPIAAELSLCERYYAKSYQQDMPPGSGTQTGCFNFVAAYTGIKDRWTVQFPTTMRTIPTMTVYSRSGTIGNFYDEDATADIAAGTHEVGDRSFAFYASGSFTAGNQMNVHWVADAEL